jgi:hypothetical protein
MAPPELEESALNPLSNTPLTATGQERDSERALTPIADVRDDPRGHAIT